MIGFFIKKAFFDGWDNLFQILILNVIFLCVGFGGFFLAGAASDMMLLSMGILLATAIAEGILWTAASKMLARIASYRSFGWKDFLEAIRLTWKHGALFSLLAVGIALLFFVTTPYYFGIGNMVGFALGMLLFWLAIIILLSLQWFLPIRSQLDDNFVKCLKKSFIVFFDNPGFSLFMFFYSLVLLGLSLVCVMLLPGITGIMLAQNEAFRLRLYKYDWMEKHPELDARIARKSIPWEELIADDVETVGYRSFKSFIFPWKD